MDNKKILIVSRGFYPDNSPRSHRTTELAKEFAREGHEVTVITPIYEKSQISFAQDHNITIKDLGAQRWTSPDFGKSKIGKLLTRASNRFLLLAFEYPGIELMFLVANALKKEKGYNLLISIAVPYPIHWGVAKVWKGNHQIATTWIADCGDPYMGNTMDSFRKWFYFGWIEKWFMRKANFISIPIESARNAYYFEFHDKIKIIPQGFRIKPIELAKGFIEHDVPTFAYAGGFMTVIRDPGPFLDYLIKSEMDFRFIIITNSRSLVEQYLPILRNKMEIRAYIPREELLELLSRMDFLVNLDNNSKIAQPSKLIDYAISGRPILNITKDLDTENIDRFLKGDYSGNMELPDINNYRIENVCASFLDLLDAPE